MKLFDKDIIKNPYTRSKVWKGIALSDADSSRTPCKDFRSQSAMEYLMTYGWAILIIAIVLAAFFGLGVFNPYTFTPKASPGSCQVIRPEGAGTTNFISLQGECNGEIPQYVAQFNGGGTVTLPISNIIPTGAQQRTAVIWFKDAAPLASRDALSLSINNGCITNGGAYFEINVGQYSDAAELNAWCTNEPFPINIVQNGWYFIAYEYNGTAQIGYLSNGTKLSRISGIYTYNSPAANIIIGYGDDGPPNYWLGEIANVQIYNTALSSNNIKALYQEGIGGAPINIQNLVGWWPLNGNANDYSGNNNNGVPTNVTYVSNWYSGYSAP